MPPVSVLIKPASSKCNLKCQYCFYHDVASSREVADFGLMSLETIETIVRKVLAFAEGHASFAFQGGEPTLRGLDFFRDVVALQKKHNVNHASISNALQTNGYVINAEWARFLHDNHFLVGLSLDGPPEVHDACRVDGGGRGTHARVMRAAGLFDRYRVDYNILFTVTATSARRAPQLYEYFRQHDFSFLQFMPCLDPLGGERGEHEYSLTSEHYAEFLKKFFDKWAADFLGGREVSVRYFDNLVRLIMGTPPEMCSLLGSCQCQFVFEADGSVYPCDFYVTDAWKLGDIREKGLLELYQSEACRRFITTSHAARPECLGCEWKSLCRGGCRRDRDLEGDGELARSYFCESYKEFLGYATPKLAEVARYVRDFHAGQAAARTAR